MRVKIEAQPGELRAKAQDVVRVLERLTGESLIKASPVKVKQTAAEFEYPVLRRVMKRSQTQAEQIRRTMERKIAEVLR